MTDRSDPPLCFAIGDPAPWASILVLDGDRIAVFDEPKPGAGGAGLFDPLVDGKYAVGPAAFLRSQGWQERVLLDDDKIKVLSRALRMKWGSGV